MGAWRPEPPLAGGRGASWILMRKGSFCKVVLYLCQQEMDHGRPCCLAQVTSDLTYEGTVSVSS
jgi:hypothetical protein